MQPIPLEFFIHKANIHHDRGMLRNLYSSEIVPPTKENKKRWMEIWNLTNQQETLQADWAERGWTFPMFTNLCNHHWINNDTIQHIGGTCACAAYNEAQLHTLKCGTLYVAEENPDDFDIAYAIAQWEQRDRENQN